MIRRLFHPSALALVLALGACSGGHGGNVPGDSGDSAPFDAIAEGETVRFAGTEPFWGGEVTNGMLTYTTPDNPEGEVVPVSRFAGRGGLSFSGELSGQPMTLAVTPGECSDGMSDRTYPFVVTLRVGEDLRNGCAWTERQQPRTAPE